MTTNGKKPMAATSIRAELLAQHAEIRGLIAAASAAVDKLRRGEEVQPDLRVSLARLADAIRRHNLREVELLADILPTVDAWGPARTEVMVREHNAEHAEMYSVLVEAGATNDPARAIELASRLCERMLEHMVVEEKIMLSEDVLRDTDVPREYFGG